MKQGYRSRETFARLLRVEQLRVVPNQQRLHAHARAHVLPVQLRERFSVEKRTHMRHAKSSPIVSDAQAGLNPSIANRIGAFPDKSPHARRGSIIMQAARKQHGGAAIRAHPLWCRDLDHSHALLVGSDAGTRCTPRP